VKGLRLRRAALSTAGLLSAALSAVVLATMLVALWVPSGAQAVSYSAQEVQFVRLLNEYRVSLGVEPLMVSDLASDAAEKHSHDMATYRFFSHTTLGSDFFPIGSDGGDRLVLRGYPSYFGWGENIAAGPSAASGVLEAWKGSDTHNQMMSYAGFKVLGIGLVYDQDAPYKYYWTVDFGVAVDETARWLDDSGSTTTSTTSTTTSTTTTTTTTVPPTTTTTVPTVTTTTVTTTSTTLGGAVFADVPVTHRFYEPIVRLAAAGIVNGSAQGWFYPDNNVTRAQFAKIVVLAVGAHSPDIDNVDRPTFVDVPYSGASYPFDFVEEAAGLGIIQGLGDGTFAPQKNVTRLQLALMLVRAGGDGLAAPPAAFLFPFTDVPGYGRSAVATALYNGLLSGKTATKFDPYGFATRGHVARMVDGLMQALSP
jgi:uncharacterized protein YkwD